MHRVSVPQTRRIKSRPVMIDRTRPVDNFIFAVAVHVTDAEIMIALPSVVPVAGGTVVAVEGPYSRKPAVSEIPCRQHRPGIVTAAHHQARSFAVEIRDARQKTVHPVAVIV